MTAFDKDNLHIIFSKLVGWWLHKFNYSQNISKLGKSMVVATLELYESVQKQLLPTPTKSHYAFNLRDVSKVFQVSMIAGAGLLMLTALPQFLCGDHIVKCGLDRWKT
jgi:dynein heavy chain